MKSGKIIKHSLTLEFECEGKNRVQQINNPNIYEGEYYSDWHYRAVSFLCEYCNKNHNFEI